KRYRIVIDRGSTGSRIHVFQYLIIDSGHAFDFSGRKNGLVSMRVSPGFPASAEDPDGAGGSVLEMLEFGTKMVPKEDWGKTELRLMATAGRQELHHFFVKRLASKNVIERIQRLCRIWRRNTLLKIMLRISDPLLSTLFIWSWHMHSSDLIAKIWPIFTRHICSTSGGWLLPIPTKFGNPPDLAAAAIKTTFWKESGMICLDFSASDVTSDAIFVNGVAYWETRGGRLFAYDVKNEIYSVQKVPFDESGALTNIKGEVYYVRGRYNHALKSCMLDVYGDGVMSLKNTIRIPVDDIEDSEFVDFAVLANSCDDVVAVVVKVSQLQKCVYAYHVKDTKVQGPVFFSHCEKLIMLTASFLCLVSNHCRRGRLFDNVNSLVSIGGY
ncbi:hypothetical protein M8C21_002496, partial [Ambrosia artemisiifolia]